MPFNIDFKPRFTRPVKVLIPDGEGFLEQTFSATFDALDIETFAVFDLSSPDGARDFLRRVLVDAADLVDAAGEPVVFSDKLRDRLISLAWVRSPLVTAYLQGFRSAAEGN